MNGSSGWSAYIHNNGSTHEHRFLKSGVAVVSSAIPNTKNSWEHVAWVVDGNAQPSLYINGNLVFTASNTAAINSPGAAQVYIGADQTSAGAAGFFPGLLDEVRLYNKALSRAEVADIYNRPK